MRWGTDTRELDLCSFKCLKHIHHVYRWIRLLFNYFVSWRFFFFYSYSRAAKGLN